MNNSTKGGLYTLAALATAVALVVEVIEVVRWVLK